MRKLLAVLLMALTTSVSAQYVGTLPPNGEAKFFYSEDTDKFSVKQGSVGLAISNGLGFRIGRSEYSAPTLNASSNFAQLTYVNVSNKYDFHGAIGIRQLKHSTNVAKEGEILADRIISRSSGLGDGDISDIRRDAPTWAANEINSTGNVSGNRNYVVADAEIRLKKSEDLTIGLSIATDVVDSVKSIQTATTFLTVAGDVDYQVSENLNLNVRGGNTHYSDDNDRLFLTTKLTWSFLPEYGVSAFLRTKNYEDSNPGSLNYFSPRTLAQQAIGLQVRKPFNGLVFTAGGEVGREQAGFQDGSSSSNPISAWSLGLQTNPGRRHGVTYGVTLVKATHSNSAGNSGSYNWTGLNVWLKVPF